MNQRFGPDRRLHNRAEFTRAYDTGSKRHGRYVIVFLVANSRQTSRLGVAVTRKFGGAVERNRAKRRLREIYRRLPVPAGVDVVIVPKREFCDASFTAIDADLRAVLGRGGDAFRSQSGGVRSRRPRERSRGPSRV
jgi:ribonuclease P protein component